MKNKILESCNLCPFNCHINRYKLKGRCNSTDKIKVAYYHLHLFEEPIISGKNGSGTIFFSNCNLKCIFCQNKKISQEGYGKEITIDRLRQIYIELKEKNATNINLVTPTMYVPQIIESLDIKDKLNIPIVYNTSSYENTKTIKQLENYIDIYLADFKYYDDGLAEKYSKVKNYREVAAKAIEEMYNQTGKYNIKNNIMQSGVIVRILVLPGHIEDSKKILDYLYNKYKDNIIISIMNQYTPPKNKLEYKNLNRKLIDKEYNKVIEYALNLGIKNAYIQDGNTQNESYIPNFNKKIV